MRRQMLDGMGMGIRVSELIRGDRILMFGLEAEVLDLKGIEDFPAALGVSLRRWREDSAPGRPITIALPHRETLMGLVLMRNFVTQCWRCRVDVPIRINLARGTPGPLLCGRCENPALEGTVVLPTLTRRRHSPE